MNEVFRDIISHHLQGAKSASTLVQEAYTLTANLKTIINKPIKISPVLIAAEQKTVDDWATAFLMLKNYPSAYKAFNKLVKRVIFRKPDHGEDAAWQDSNDTMYLYTLKAGYNPRHMLKGLVHEIGHAIEDAKRPSNLFFKPPYANDYCATPGEDFAESYMLYTLEPDYLSRVTPQKYEAIRRMKI